jgi:hypothetical protein
MQKKTSRRARIMPKNSGLILLHFPITLAAHLFRRFRKGYFGAGHLVSGCIRAESSCRYTIYGEAGTRRTDCEGLRFGARGLTLTRLRALIEPRHRGEGSDMPSVPKNDFVGISKSESGQRKRRIVTGPCPLRRPVVPQALSRKDRPSI